MENRCGMQQDHSSSAILCPFFKRHIGTGGVPDQPRLLKGGGPGSPKCLGTEISQ